MDPTLEIATQIRDMIQSQNQLYMAQARLLRGQLAAMEAIAEASGNVDTSRLTAGFDEAERQIQAAEAAMENLANTSSSTMSGITTGTTNATGALGELGGALVKAGDHARRFGIGAAVMDGFRKGIDLAVESLVSAGNILQTIGSSLFDLGKTIFAQLLSPFDALFNLVASKGAPSNDLRKAYEELRKTFGDLSTNEGAAVIRMFKSLGGTLGDTGLRTRRILGMPADQLRAMTELAKGLGDRFNMVFNQGLIENAGNIVGFKKALDLSDESMKTTARIASTTGRTMDEVLREQANYAIQLGDAFGISSMEISRGMQEMENDMKHFGGLSKKTLAETTVYAKNLGIEVKTLSGIMEAFDNFDSAADAAARLNQQFGIQLDALEMLREEDPARRADMLRDSLNAAGVSYTNLDRRSKSYLASQLQISEAEAELLFNEKNRGLSLDQIKKKSGEAEKKQLTQVEVMDRLADSIERLVQQSSNMEAGIFANFFKGFTEGIMNSREMRTLLRDITQIFQMAIRYGRQLGRAFVELFPGIKGILGGFTDLFNPARWRNMFRGVVDAFKSFFKTIQTNPEAGLKALFDRLKAIFFDQFDASKSGGSKLIEGFKTFFGSILRVMLAAVRIIIPELLKSLRDGIRYINDVINGRAGGGMGIDLAGAWTEISTTFGELFDSLFEMLDNFWDTYGDDILTALQDMWTSITSRVMPWLREHWKGVLLGLGAFFAGPAIASSLMSGLGAMFSSVLSEAIPGMGGAGGGGAAGGAAAATGAMSGGASAVAAAGQAAGTVNTFSGELGSALNNIGTITAAVAGLGNLFNSIFEFAKKIQDNGITGESIASAVGVMLGGATLVGGLIYLLTNIDINSLGEVAGLLAGGAMAAVISLMAGPMLTDFGNAIATFAGSGGPLSVLLSAVGNIANIMNDVPNFGQAVSVLGQLLAGIGPLASAMAMLAGSGAVNRLVDGATSVASTVTGMLGSAVNTAAGAFGFGPIVSTPSPAAATAPSGAPSNPFSDGMGAIRGLIGLIAAEIPLLIAATDLVADMPVEEATARFNIIGTVASLLTQVIIPGVNELKNSADSLTSGVTGVSGATYDFTGVLEVVDNLFSQVGGMVGTIIEATRDVSVEKLDAVSRLGPIFEGVSTVLATVTDAVVAIAGTSGTKTGGVNLISGGAQASINSVATGLSNFDPDMFDSIFTSLGSLVEVLIRSTEFLTGTSIDEIRAKASVVASITEAATEGLNETLATILNPTVLALVSQPDAQTKIDMIKNFISDVGDTMFNPRTGMLHGIGYLIEGITRLDISPAQAPVLQAASVLIGSLFEGFTSLTRAIASLTDEAVGQAPPNSTRLTDFAENIGTVFEELRGILPGLISNINAAFTGVKVGTLSRRTDALNSIIGMFTNLFEFSKALDEFNRQNTGQGAGGAGAGGLQRLNELFTGDPSFFDVVKNVIDGMKNISVRGIPDLGPVAEAMQKISEIATSLQEVSDSTNGLNLTNIVQTIGGGEAGTNFAAQNTIIGAIHAISNGLRSITSSPQTLNTLRVFSDTAGEQIVAVFDHLANISRNITPIVEGMTDETRTRVSDLIATITDTVTAIQGINSVDLSTTLTSLTDNLGLGRTASYTIDNENFNLTINMSVYIKAEELERIFYERATENDWTGVRFANPGAFNNRPNQKTPP